MGRVESRYLIIFLLVAADSLPASANTKDGQLVVPPKTDECRAVAFQGLGEQACGAVEASQEELGKFALNLLNCQRRLEGRGTYDCMSNHSLRDCTEAMDEIVWGQYVQMLGIAIQECRSIENSVWRSRVTSTMTGLTGTLTALDNMTTKTLEELLGFRDRALDDHQKLKNTSSQLYDDLVRLRREQNQMANEFGNLTHVVASQLAGIARVEESADVLLRYFFSISSVFFYLAWACFCNLISGDRRTESSRLLLYAACAVAVVCEVSLRRLWPTAPTWILWRARGAVCLSSIGITVWHAWSYRDRMHAMEKELITIKQLLADRDKESNGIYSADTQTKTLEDVDSDDDASYDPLANGEQIVNDDDDEVDLIEDVEQSDTEEMLQKDQEPDGNLNGVSAGSGGRYTLRNTRARQGSQIPADTPILLEESAADFTRLMSGQ